MVFSPANSRLVCAFTRCTRSFSLQLVPVWFVPSPDSFHLGNSVPSPCSFHPGKSCTGLCLHLMVFPGLVCAFVRCTRYFQPVKSWIFVLFCCCCCFAFWVFTLASPGLVCAFTRLFFTLANPGQVCVFTRCTRRFSLQQVPDRFAPSPDVFSPWLEEILGFVGINAKSRYNLYNMDFYAACPIY